MKNSKTRTLCEAAMLIALAQILSYIKLYEFPNGGSVDCAMVPIIRRPSWLRLGRRRGLRLRLPAVFRRQWLRH